MERHSQIYCCLSGFLRELNENKKKLAKSAIASSETMCRWGKTDLRQRTCSSGFQKASHFVHQPIVIDEKQRIFVQHWARTARKCPSRARQRVTPLSIHRLFGFIFSLNELNFIWRKWNAYMKQNNILIKLLSSKECK